MNSGEVIYGLIGAAGFTALTAPILPPEIALYGYVVAGGCLGSIFGASIKLGPDEPTVLQSARRGISGVALAFGIGPFVVVHADLAHTPEVLMGVGAGIGAVSYVLAFLSGRFFSSLTIKDIKDGIIRAFGGKPNE